MSVHIPPWLQHLKRDRRGIPVPWINVWGAESIDRVRIAWDSHAGHHGVYVDDDFDAGPDFTRQSMQRQREAVILGLCQVCAHPVPWSRRRLVVSDMSVSLIDWHGQRVPVVVEPWLCQRCAEFAVNTCPALIRRTRHERLRIVEVTSKLQVQIVVSRGHLDGPLHEESMRLMPVMWAKVLLLHHRIEVHPSSQEVVTA